MGDYIEDVQSKLVKFEDKEEKKVEQFENEKGNDNLKGSSKKAYLKDLKSVIEQADVIIEVLDARDPMSCRNIEMEKSIIAQNKKLVLVVNKIDLVSNENARQWLKILRDEYPTFLFKATQQSQKENLSARISLHKSSLTERSEMVDDMLSSAKSIGTEELLQMLKNYCRNDSSNKKNKHAIIVGIIGFPNVGKSSLINSLKRSRVASVGNTPGLTRSVQEIMLDRDIILLDCPGVV